VSVTKDLTCKIWEPVTDGKEEEQYRCIRIIDTPGGETGMRFRACKFSKDGKYLFAVTAKLRSHSYLHRFDIHSGKHWQVIAHTRYNGGCTSCNISDDGQYLATGSSEGEVAIFRTSDMQWILRRRVHDFFITKIVFSPDSKYLFSTGGDSCLCTTKVEFTRGFVSMYRTTFMYLAVVVAVLAIILQLYRW